MKIQGLKWVPGIDLKNKIKKNLKDNVDRVNVIIWSGDTTDPGKIAREVEDAEQDLGISIWVVYEFDFKHNNYM